jgi:hypothetical protein
MQETQKRGATTARTPQTKGVKLNCVTPEIIPVQYTEENSRYLAMTPVVKQPFRLRELVNMVVGVSGKDSVRVAHVLGAGSVSYNGYHYTWPGFEPTSKEMEELLAQYPDSDPSQSFCAANAVGVILEMGGGTERKLTEMSRETASAKKTFSRRSPWDVLLAQAKETPPHYQEYDYARDADRFRLMLHYEAGERLVHDMIAAAPMRLRTQWRRLHAPSSVTYLVKRKPAE